MFLYLYLLLMRIQPGESAWVKSSKGSMRSRGGVVAGGIGIHNHSGCYLPLCHYMMVIIELMEERCVWRVTTRKVATMFSHA